MTDNLRNIVAEAARMRANKASWADVAQMSNRSAETCRQWPRRYPDIWSADNVVPRAEAKPARKSAANRERKHQKPAMPPEARATRPIPDAARSGGSNSLDPELLLTYARMRGMQYSRVQTPSPALPVVPVAKPLPIAPFPPMPQPKNQPVRHITRTNMVLATITALSLGWAIGCSLPLANRTQPRRGATVDSSISNVANELPRERRGVSPTWKSTPGAGSPAATSAANTSGLRLDARRANHLADTNSVLPLDRRLLKDYDFHSQSFLPPQCDPTPCGYCPDWPSLTEYPGGDSSASRNRQHPLPVEALCFGTA